MGSCGIIQWNCGGIKNKRGELQVLADVAKNACFCIQETKLHANDDFVIRGYNSYLYGVELEEGQNAHGGVGVLVRDGLSQYTVPLNTSFQAVAVSVKFHKRVTVCSIYLPPNEPQFELDRLEDLIRQLPEPFVVLGDFNAHNSLWGSEKTCRKGKVLERFIARNNICLLDSKEPTHVSRAHGTFSHVDLSFCSSSLMNDFHWGVNDDLMDSDHFPIMLQIKDKFVAGSRERWVLQKADWAAFHQIDWDRDDWGALDSMESRADFVTSSIVKAAEKTIPRSSGNGSGKCAVWFNEECKAAKKERSRAAKALRDKNKTITDKTNRSIENMKERVELKRAQAKARRTFKRVRAQSWKEFLGGISCENTTMEVWRRVNLLNRTYRPSIISTLKLGDELVDDRKRIADAIAERFSYVSSLNSCSEDFKRYKRENEVELDFSTNVTHEYNLPFTMWEMDSAIAGAKDSSPGPDKIHYRMIKNLNSQNRIILLQFFNDLYKSGEMPSDWKMAYVIPLLKKGKDPLSPGSYRPISLTSCLCKLYERMLNRRLTWVSGRKKWCDRDQNGYCRGKGTTDGLVALETEIHDAFVMKKFLVSVFIDLEKAFDTCWRFLILRELHSSGLRGFLPLAIKAFLSDRKFRVLVGTQMSDVFTLEMGVPQGGVLSGILFVIAMNVIMRQVTWGLVRKSVYVDDLRISVYASSIIQARARLQPVLNQIHAATGVTGFRISKDKTVVMAFNRHKPVNYKPDLALKMGGHDIKHVETVKFLGLIFDTRLRWIPHLIYLKEICLGSLNILKVIVSKNCKIDRDVLMRVYRSLIRSKLDYGCQIYGTAAPSALAMLDTVHHQALRIALGAFRTSPVQSLYVEAYEPSLSDRRSLLKIQLAARMQRLPAHYAAVNLLDRSKDNFYTSCRTKPRSFRYSVRLMKDELGIGFPPMSLLAEPEIPPWGIRKPNVCFEMAAYGKSDYSPEAIQQYFLSHSHGEDGTIYTDGSKCGDRVGSGMALFGRPGFRPLCLGRRLHGVASVFTAELYAMKLALLGLRGEENKSYCIYSDSSSALHALLAFASRTPLVCDIHQLLHHLNVNAVTVNFCWVPAHVGIRGNEMADQQAKMACDRETISSQVLPVTDVNASVKGVIYNNWKCRWEDSDNNKLREFQPSIDRMSPACGLSRWEAVKFTRLRIGHSYLTHSHYFQREEDRRDAPYCHECDRIMSVKHILLDCGRFYNERRQIFQPSELKLSVMLGKSSVDMKRKVLLFFKQIDLLKYV